MATCSIFLCNRQSSDAMCMQIWGFQNTRTPSISEAQFCFVSTKHQGRIETRQLWGIKEERYEIMGWSWTWKHAWSLPSIIPSLFLPKEKRKRGQKEGRRIKKAHSRITVTSAGPVFTSVSRSVAQTASCWPDVTGLSAGSLVPPLVAICLQWSLPASLTSGPWDVCHGTAWEDVVIKSSSSGWPDSGATCTGTLWLTQVEAGGIRWPSSRPLPLDYRQRGHRKQACTERKG